MVSSYYGRLREIEPSEVRILGYRTQPLKFEIERFSSYYQTPAPTYAAPHDQVYESVRDFFTNEPMDPGASGFGKVSGDVLANAKGSLFKSPFEARGLYEKMGNESSVINGSVQWGFPLFRVKGAREYVTFGGFDGQFDLMDQVTVSHSNDHFGDGGVNLETDIKLFYGQEDFSVFMSSSLFSQTVDFRQRMEVWI